MLGHSEVGRAGETLQSGSDDTRGMSEPANAKPPVGRDQSPARESDSSPSLPMLSWGRLLIVCPHCSVCHMKERRECHQAFPVVPPQSGAGPALFPVCGDKASVVKASLPKATVPNTTQLTLPAPQLSSLPTVVTRLPLAIVTQLSYHALPVLPSPTVESLSLSLPP